MRINKFVANASGLSRRKADEAIAAGKVTVNGQPATQGQDVAYTDAVALQGHILAVSVKHTTIMLNKPVGFVVSRSGQGSRTIYDLLPPQYQQLNPVGRLDKDSSGLLLLTDDGNLANQLTHPRYEKQKVYQVTLDKPLAEQDKATIRQGVRVEMESGEKYVSRLALAGGGSAWTVTMGQGKNRQIRRTFAALGYSVTSLHRTAFGPYQLDSLQSGICKRIAGN